MSLIPNGVTTLSGLVFRVLGQHFNHRGNPALVNTDVGPILDLRVVKV